VKLPNFTAVATLDFQGTTYYFVSDDTRREFENRKGIAR